MRKALVVLMLLAVVAIFAAEKYVWFDENTPYLGSDAKGKYGGRIVVATLSGPRTMNDTVAKETSSTDVIALFMGYGGTLVELDNYAKLHPAIAKRCEVELTDEGKMIITFWLREGIKWSDGHPFTADDFVFTVNDVYCNPDIPS
ncbi:MAG TPA: peptide ABC transporter substrate-binding protein, partial [Pseudothermotoga sp.]|nr:peptide ABC transporter substrate-binding protein [Pseudothermotoga sp.]